VIEKPFTNPASGCFDNFLILLRACALKRYGAQARSPRPCAKLLFIYVADKL
jgi:hypothetical protein